LTSKFEEALRRLDKIQESANSTEQTVNEVKATADAKPSIEIVPDKARPGSAKVVIRSAPSPIAPSPASAAPSPPGGRLGGSSLKRPMSFDSEPPVPKAMPRQEVETSSTWRSDIVEIPIQLPSRRAD
jgi:hypothetical protein